ncbi:AT-rich interactive domain-containing protein 6 isoform X2 [Populus alba x Populus x berolinensis]|nr:AT-rich interactive domain-containing protein 6 isoform X2 [Populus alba x Populus x berolinensis]
MEDSEMVAVQDLPGDSDANKPSDATVKEQEETADVSEDQEPNENRQALVADDDNTASLATDVPMTDTPALPDDGKTATDENINRRVVEEKTDGDDGSSVQNQPQTATPSTQIKELDSAAKSKNVWTDIKTGETDVAGTLEEQAAFMKDLEIFYKQNIMDFKPPKFYGEPLNCLKLWRSVIKLGGYEVVASTAVVKHNGFVLQMLTCVDNLFSHSLPGTMLVTANKLWRQVGESFHPPKETGELQLPSPPLHQATSVEKEVKSLNFSRPEKPLKSFGTISRMKIFPIGGVYILILIWFVESGFHKQKTDERPVNAETDKDSDGKTMHHPELVSLYEPLS